VGSLLREMLPREEYVLTTKVAMPMGSNPNMSGLSRKHIIEGMDKSLKRLGLDYVDQLIIHRHPHGLPWHVAVPIEETLEALNDLVKAGKVMYLGASSMFAWQFAELQMTAERNGWARFISMQNHYNLIYREEEREMNPYCEKSGVGLTPWSPLARGILTNYPQISIMLSPDQVIFLGTKHWHILPGIRSPNSRELPYRYLGGLDIDKIIPGRGHFIDGNAAKINLLNRLIQSLAIIICKVTDFV
jgi:diketogulonate reductase-like aldo/keto reductase